MRITQPSATHSHVFAARAWKVKTLPVCSRSRPMEDQALEATVKARKSPYILHIASHGFFLPNAKRDVSLDQRGFGLTGTAFGGGWWLLANLSSCDLA